MASFLFGQPIFFDTQKDLLGDTHSEAEIRKMMAREAEKNININNAQNDAILQVNGMKEEFGNGVCTRIIVYNASGGVLTNRNEKTWSGRWSKYKLPTTIECGQWAAALHVKRSGAAAGSMGIMSYNMQGFNNVLCVGWDVPWSGSNHGSCYTMTTADWGKTSWETVEKWCETDPAVGSDKCGSIRVDYNIDQDSSPILTVKITHL